ncbi:MAG: glucosaminidase domain-containing protein [Saprospiraceae bacterium]
MKDESNKVAGFIKESGLNILILGIILLVVIKKDFSFSINLQSPKAQPKQEQMIPPVPPTLQGEIKKESKITETYTEKGDEDLSKSSIIRSNEPTNLSYEEVLEQVNSKMKAAYIRRFSHVAIDEMRKFKIPASISLAQGMLLSAAGTSQQALNGNNHFNLLCGKEFKGDKMNFDNGQCFRAYTSPWRSFRNHSELLATNHSYLTDLGTVNYQSWAKELEKVKFSTQKNYAQSLINVIESFNLNRFDY